MNIFSNYGLFWRRDQVPLSQEERRQQNLESLEWPHNGKLYGIGVKRKKQGPVNFAFQIGVYALYDDQFRLVYVGQAGRGDRGLYRRLRAHTRNILSERWSRFSWLGLREIDESNELKPIADENAQYSKNTVLDQIEAALIAISEPLRNRQSGRFGTAVHYRQYKGSASDDPSSESEDDDSVV